ncbi:AAA family ATPase [Planktothrix agardhii 1806]|uniref:AAA family ATPase n=1 Tax=Planktothrix agardhii TaxID=1160 RepID=UPI001F182C0B|nr:AAA family ATPase [Planktothrix agardhii]MCF3572637.1 AAA family ATPase [Planktothrix agardhii 1805]MCF3584274.1 AAA family ATPase [Planktothrix agardhii 1803]MCF3600958.1 AAA family ATPase [Planktothrix agardhii 1804]MCF3618133.1 AAA family ATPase [Planktothrix agardhii 1806]
MGKTLTEIAQDLRTANKKVQLIYAFNGMGKTRLSREFKQLIMSMGDDNEDEEEADMPEFVSKKILYYNAFTEDLFYWNNDLTKLKIQSNTFTKWVLQDQGQDQNIITNFQRYTNKKLTPNFSADFSEVSFSLESGDDASSGNLKISKGEESNFIWSIFYTLINSIIETLDDVNPDFPETTPFDDLEYVFIDDPVSSLDENHLIELAVDIAELIRKNKSKVKFIITTHNPLFYNVLQNELGSNDKQTGYKAKDFKKYRLDKNEDGLSELKEQPDDSSFSYHLHLKAELEKAMNSNQLSKYHFNYLRNILEKTTIFFGYKRWGELLPKSNNGETNPYEARMINLRTHSKYAGEEINELTDDERRVLTRLIKHLDKIYKPDLTDSIEG